MEFEFDPKKNRTNKEKHGIDFIEIQELWNDPDLIEIPARTEDEERFLVIGKVNRKIWACIYTPRGDRIRIISARRARDEEKNLYEST